MSVQLFQRKNNSIRLTDTGEQLFHRSGEGIRSLERAIRAAMHGDAEVSVKVPVTLAIRWLIPGLQSFQSRNPDIRVRIETTAGISTDHTRDVDVIIAYFPLSALPPHAEIFLEDRCRPYLSPNLLQELGGNAELERVPALQCASGNWDWRLWLEACGRTSTELSYAGHFDLDDAALRAAVAGMGMVLAPEFLVRDDLLSERLCPLPGTEGVLLGAYVVTRAGPASRQTEKFVHWLSEHRELPGSGSGTIDGNQRRPTA